MSAEETHKLAYDLTNEGQALGREIARCAFENAVNRDGRSGRLLRLDRHTHPYAGLPALPYPSINTHTRR